MLDTTIHALYGVGGAEVALTAARVATGTFFAISGYHKLFNKDRHAALVATLKENKIPLVKVNEWFVPTVEFLGGTALALGFLTVPTALVLAFLLCVACLTDGRKRVEGYAPINLADRVDDWLYLCEVIYIFVLGLLFTMGPGTFAVDNVLLPLLH